MKIQIRPAALSDLADGFAFYETQQTALGGYFLDCLFADIDSLVLYAGIHSKRFDAHRLLSRTFPYAIYYDVIGDNCVRKSGARLPPRSVVDAQKTPQTLGSPWDKARGLPAPLRRSPRRHAIQRARPPLERAR